MTTRTRATLVAAEQAGSGEPLVLLHGLATTRAIWASVTPALARTRRVVTVDIPGFGDSAPVGPGFELEAVADRIARGLAARGVRGPFDLVGHSLGAGIALTLAVARPRLVRRLVLVAPAGLTSFPPFVSQLLAPGVDPALALRRRLAPLTDLPWGRRLLLAFAAADGAAVPPTQARLLVGASASSRRGADAFAAITRADLRPLLRRTPAALGMVWGAADRTVPVRVAQVVLALRPDAELELVEHAGHVVMVERPDEFVSRLERLLARLPKDATNPSAGTSNLT